MDRKSERRKREALRRNIERVGTEDLGPLPCGHGCRIELSTGPRYYRQNPWHRGFRKSGTYGGTFAGKVMVVNRKCPVHGLHPEEKKDD